MKAVFADAFYFVACLNRADQHHNKVASFASQNQRPIVTTTWVLTEVADAFAASTARDRLREASNEGTLRVFRNADRFTTFKIFRRPAKVGFGWPRSY